MTIFYLQFRVGLKTADYRRTNRRPPQDSTGCTAEHCRTRKIFLFHFRRGSML